MKHCTTCCYLLKQFPPKENLILLYFPAKPITRPLTGAVAAAYFYNPRHVQDGNIARTVGASQRTSSSQAGTPKIPAFLPQETVLGI